MRVAYFEHVHREHRYKLNFLLFVAVAASCVVYGKSAFVANVGFAQSCPNLRKSNGHLLYFDDLAKPNSRCVVRGAWCVVRGAWCVVRGAWCVVRGAWCVMRGER
jgi:hypothetical protein